MEVAGNVEGKARRATSSSLARTCYISNVLVYIYSIIISRTHFSTNCIFSYETKDYEPKQNEKNKRLTLVDFF